MTTPFRLAVLATVSCLCLAFGQGEGMKTRIGLLDLDTWGGGETFESEALDVLMSHLAEVGAYEIFTQDAMEASYAKLEQRFPQHCREPRCACAIGSSLQMDRMLYGTLDKNEKRVAVRLTLVDVMSRQIIEKVELEGEPGVGLSDVLRVAVQKLHGLVDEDVDTRTHTYFGRQVDNRKQLLVSAPACIGAGLVFGLASGSLLKKDENGTVLESDQFSYSSFDGDMDDALGIASGADLIPLFGRPAAMANAYVAVSDDAYGVLYNPAGLGWVANAEATLGYQYRFGLNVFGAAFVNKATREIGFGQGFLHCSDREKLYYENYFYSSFAYKFNEWIPFLRPIGVGVTLKILNESTGEGTSESSSTGSSFGMGLDLGAQLELSENIRGGILFKNVPRLMRTYNSLTDYSYSEIMPPTFYWGGSFQAGYLTFLVCEVQTPLNEDQVWRFAGGIERILFRVFRIRAGIQKEADFDTPWKFTGGFGLNVNTESLFGRYVILDGSYEYNTLSVFAHPVNISLRFGF
ncbi:MAG: hypothetical protein GF418_12210 [Chitinivibrionales bacterium]|nr:hypothetical protein [Chitinivibrionales bacterium]MBD3396382.1 hypothetical protein [Chitinivibrionales bacterium]